MRCCSIQIGPHWAIWQVAGTKWRCQSKLICVIGDVHPHTRHPNVFWNSVKKVGASCSDWRSSDMISCFLWPFRLQKTHLVQLKICFWLKSQPKAHDATWQNNNKNNYYDDNNWVPQSKQTVKKKICKKKTWRRSGLQKELICLRPVVQCVIIYFILYRFTLLWNLPWIQNPICSVLCYCDHITP